MPYLLSRTNRLRRENMAKRVHKKSETCYVIQMDDGKVYTAYTENIWGCPFVHSATSSTGPGGKYFKQYSHDYHSRLLERLNEAILDHPA